MWTRQKFLRPHADDTQNFNTLKRVSITVNWYLASRPQLNEPDDIGQSLRSAIVFKTTPHSMFLCKKFFSAPVYIRNGETLKKTYYVIIAIK